ncbi:MAG TPA: hypothetical protein VK031_05945 [Tissierellaceae bacterium]|nr:hypothetical protein [Tissierellaceae bacterium]
MRYKDSWTLKDGIKKEKERPIYLLQKLGAYIVVVLWYEAQQEPETINIGI